MKFWGINLTKAQVLQNIVKRNQKRPREMDKYTVYWKTEYCCHVKLSIDST